MFVEGVGMERGYGGVDVQVMIGVISKQDTRITYTPFTHTTKSHRKSSLVVVSCNRVKSSSFFTIDV